MSSGAVQGRAAASRVARVLLDKGKPGDAVEVLAVWAANGPNDAEGQGLLAEALRIDPASRLARLAFERMEGIRADHALLDEAVARWSAEEITRVDREMARPGHLRAHVGVNNNVKYNDQTFHIHT